MPLLSIGEVRTLGQGLAAGSEARALMDPSGAQVVMDFLQKALLDGRGYQIHAGTITAPFVGDIEITDAKAEMAIDAAVGIVIMPVRVNVSVEVVGGTLPQTAVKSVATVSSGGDAFVPLPLLRGGVASNTSGRSDAAGGVSVTAELVTTTVVHFYQHSDSVPGAQVSADLLGTGVVPGAGCVYVQVGAVGTGASYFGKIDYLEFTTGQLGI